MRTIFTALALVIPLIIALPYQILVLIIKIFDDRTARMLSYKFLRMLSMLIFWAAGVNLHIESIENMECDHYLIVANHRSILDILCIVIASKKPMSFIGKKSLLKVPVLNLWMYMIGCLFLDRKSLKKGFATMMKGIDKMKNDENMGIFPQGTRNKGDEFLPFKMGSFKLATESDAKVIPMTIFGTDNILEANETLKVSKADVYVKIFDPIETKDLTDEEKKGLSKKTEKLVYDKYMEYKEKNNK